MEVILLQRIVNLGQIGDVVSVKPGYARNYLIPNNKALRATEENKKVFEEKKAQLELDNLNHKKEAEAVFAKVNDYKITIIRSAGEAGHLYGSVKSQDIAKGLVDSGFKTDKSQVVIGDPIKTIGVFQVSLVLHSEVIANVLVSVARSKEESATQIEAFLNPKKEVSGYEDK
jgi:large subunit ribosomal protein L9